MPTDRARTKRQNRYGFTLLELLLVLAILVAVVAIAAPTVNGSLDGYRLKQTAELINGEWTKARNVAIRNGRIYVFQYEVEGTRYWTQPWSSSVDETETSDSSASSEIMQIQTSADGGKSLPDRMSFFGGETESDSRTATLDADPGALDTQSSQLGTPIVFYPDGTTSTARVILTNEREQYVMLNLRGLTGLARVSELLTEDDLPQ